MAERGKGRKEKKRYFKNNYGFLQILSSLALPQEGLFFPTVLGLCEPIMTMHLGFFPIPSPLGRTSGCLTLAAAPTSGPWEWCQRAWGRWLRRRGGAAALRTSRFILGGGLNSGSGAAARSPSAPRPCRCRGAGQLLGQKSRGGG